MNENDYFNNVNEIISYGIFDSLKMIFLDFFLSKASSFSQLFRLGIPQHLWSAFAPFLSTTRVSQNSVLLIAPLLSLHAVALVMECRFLCFDHTVAWWIDYSVALVIVCFDKMEDIKHSY